MTIQGQDWASYQSATPTTAGLTFTFIKATEGTGYVSPRMASQTTTARKAGLVVGFYHFLRPGDMKAQAAYFVTKAASVEGDLLAADWEDPGVSCAQKDTFIKEVKRLRPTHKVVLYCNTSYWKTRDTTSYCGDGLWIADPNNPAGKPGVTHAWLFQQYSSAGGLDRNVANFSTKAALKTWATGTTPPAPPTPPEPSVSTFTVEEMAANYGTINSLTEVDAKGKPVPHSGGYYLAHIHFDAGEIHDQCARIEDGQKALTTKVDALGTKLDAILALLTPKS